MPFFYNTKTFHFTQGCVHHLDRLYIDCGQLQPSTLTEEPVQILTHAFFPPQGRNHSCKNYQMSLTVAVSQRDFFPLK